MVPTSLSPLRSANVSPTPSLSPLSSFSLHTSSSSSLLSSKPSYSPCSLRVNISNTHLRASSKYKGLKVNCSVKSEPLKDLPGSSGIMQTMGRDMRLEYAASFESYYYFRLLYYAGTQYPIMGAIRMSYPYQYELYKRVDEPSGKEKYVALSTFPKSPSPDEINDAFLGKPRNQTTKEHGICIF